MATIRLIPEETAPAEAKEVLAEIRQHFKLDTAPNSARAFANHPERLQQVWSNYKGAEKDWGQETLFLINLAIAITRGCSYAINFNTAILKRSGYDDEKIDRLVNLIASTAQRYDYYNGLQLEPDVTPDVVARKQAA